MPENRLRTLLILLLAGLLLAGCATLPGQPSATPIAISDTQFDPSQVPTVFIPTVTPGLAPTLSLDQLGGGQASLEAWRGRGIILNFWATWCYPCREEMPALQAIQAANPNIVVVAVNYRETPEQAQAFVEEFGLSFPVLMDQEGKLGHEFDVVALPTTFFIDAEGHLTGSHFGPLDEAELQEIVDELQVP